MAEQWPRRAPALPSGHQHHHGASSLNGGRLAFGAADPLFGVLNADGSRRFSRRGEILDHRGNPNKLRLSSDGSVVAFSFDTLTNAGRWSQQIARFDMVNGQLTMGAPDIDDLQAPANGNAPDTNWENTETPCVRWQALKLKTNETSRCLALAPSGWGFVLGTDWYVRFYDNPVTPPRWQVFVPFARAINITADSRYVVAALGDGTLRWYTVDKGREVLALFIHPDGKRWIAWTPQGFFDASPGGSERFGYHLNQGVDKAGVFVTAEQLTEQFYRRDLIAGLFSPGGEAALKAAAKQLGDVRQVLSGGLPPKLELLSSARSNSTGKFVFKARVIDQGGGVNRLIYRIDGEEIQGRPADIPGAGPGTVGRRFSLAPGRREISLIATNTNGVASAPVTAVVDVEAPSTRPALFVFAVGVTRYRDHSLTQGVQYAAADAQAVVDQFQACSQGLFHTSVVRVLSDHAATRAAIETTLTDMAAMAGPEDVFVVYFAGHGTAIDGQYHFLPQGVSYTSLETMNEQSLNQQDLRTLMQKIPSNKTLLLLDTCSSGAFAMGRGIAEKDAIIRMGRISGRAILAATKSDEVAYEENGHGVFTHALIEGLKNADRDGNTLIEIGELADYIEKLVPAITLKKYGIRQFPVRSISGASFPVGRKP
ncbi:caspase family protein [Desulfosarcina cetonica]|uniref:caspase family protein n=1 Tax=Desulfosarcina cetonica TaxID=90730 RepID=UPI0006D1805D|nr:caspase family protein [Desulfosarcina cetonica]